MSSFPNVCSQIEEPNVITCNEKLNKKEVGMKTKTPLHQEIRTLTIRLDRAELEYPDIFEEYRKSEKHVNVDNEVCIVTQSIDNVSKKRKFNEMTDNESSGSKKNGLPEKHVKVHQKGPTRKKRNMKRQCNNLKEKIFNEAPGNEFMKDEIVLGTIPGYCPWPARIVNIVGETIFIEFFGTGEMYVNFIVFFKSKYLN